MTDVQQGWREWLETMEGELRDTPFAAFRAGAKWALDDAAEAIEAIADGVARTQNDPNAYARMYAYDNASKTCRDRAFALDSS